MNAIIYYNQEDEEGIIILMLMSKVETAKQHFGFLFLSLFVNSVIKYSVYVT